MTRRRFRCSCRMLCAGAWLAFGTSQLLATVIIDTVPVGNPGNGNDPATGSLYGGVSYRYNIGKTEVTNSQYVEFLNTKATLQDPSSTSNDLLHLYNSNMSSDGNSGGINRSGTGTGGNPFVYSVQSGEGNQPVTYVSWYDSIRFANWLNNGQGTGDTETGAYTLGTLGANATPTAGLSITRNVGAQVFLPSESEWYKAAYYSGVGSTYYNYPTGTNTEPNSDNPSGAVANAGNFYRDDSIANSVNDGFAVTGSTGFSSSQNYLTDAGAYTASPGPYGTLDQGGNVFEWNEAIVSGSFRGIRGGSWDTESYYLLASYRNYYNPPDEGALNGFRVAMIPEPGSLLLLGLGTLGLLRIARRRKA